MHEGGRQAPPNPGPPGARPVTLGCCVGMSRRHDILLAERIIKTSRRHRMLDVRPGSTKGCSNRHMHSKLAYRSWGAANLHRTLRTSTVPHCA